MFVEMFVEMLWSVELDVCGEFTCIESWVCTIRKVEDLYLHNKLRLISFYRAVTTDEETRHPATDLRSNSFSFPSLVGFL